MPDGEAPGVPPDEPSEPAGAGPSGPPREPAPTSPPSDPPPGPAKSTREIAQEALLAAGLTKPPKASSGPRRLLLFTLVILVVLIALVVGSLVALGHLKTTVTLPPSTSTTAPTSSTSTTTTTTLTSAAPPGGVSPLVAYGGASADGVVLTAVGAGGQPLPFVRTTSRTYITDPSAAPVVVYGWNGTCAPCAAENLVVVSSLDALGGKFTGLATTTETGGFVTIDLRHATYHGPVVLEASEVDGPTGLPDQTYSAQALEQFRAYDRAPFTKHPDAYPFLDVGGHFIQVGPSFASALLQGLTLRQIATDLETPDSSVTRAIDGSADELTAAICDTLAQLSQQRPLICANPSIAAIEPGLPTTAPGSQVAH
jgi:hypothetical protein